MARQTQQRLSSLGLTVLGEMGFIHHQHTATIGRLLRQASPTQQFGAELQRQRLAAPMVMKPHRSHHQQTGGTAAQQSAGGSQSRKGFAQTHLVGQHSPAACQQPTHAGPLMGKQLAAIGQRLFQISRGNQLTVSWQRWQGAAHLIEPLLQGRINGKTLTKLLR